MESETSAKTDKSDAFATAKSDKTRDATVTSAPTKSSKSEAFYFAYE